MDAQTLQILLDGIYKITTHPYIGFLIICIALRILFYGLSIKFGSEKE